MKAISELKMESELARLSRGITDDSSQEIIDHVNAVVTKIFVCLYAKDEEFETLNALRAHVYYGGHKDLEVLPPTDGALQNHVLRAVFQTYIWVSALEPVPEVLDPFTSSGPVKQRRLNRFCYKTEPYLKILLQLPTVNARKMHQKLSLQAD